MNEIKQQILAAGVTEEQASKIDFDKITALFEQSANIEDLSRAMKESFPNFDEAEFKKIVSENSCASRESEEAQDLSEEDLASVAGGSIGSWMKKNKSWLIPVATMVGLGITAAVIGKVMSNRAAAQKQAFLQKQPAGNTNVQAEEPVNTSMDESFGNASFASI